VVDAASAVAIGAAALVPSAPVVNRAIDQLAPDQPTLRQVDVETPLAAAPAASDGIAVSVSPASLVAFSYRRGGRRRAGLDGKLAWHAADGFGSRFRRKREPNRSGGDAVPRLMQGAAVADDAFVGHANPTSESDQGQDRNGGDDHALHSTGDCTRDLTDRAGFGSEGRD
jgi:hypothetical protein